MRISQKALFQKEQRLLLPNQYLRRKSTKKIENYKPVSMFRKFLLQSAKKIVGQILSPF